MKTQIARWGNSVAIRIPKRVAEAAKFRPGDQVEMAVEESGVLRVRKRKSKPSLKELLRAITPENLHSETDWGASQGDELW